MRDQAKYENEIRELYRTSDIMLLISGNTGMVPDQVSDGMAFLSDTMKDILDRLWDRMGSEPE